MGKKVHVNKPINWSAINLSEQVKSIVFDVDDEGNLKGIPVILFDPFNIPVTGSYVGSFFPRGLMSIADGSNPAVTVPVSTPTEDTRYNGAWVNAHMMVRTGDAVAGLPQNLRTPTTFKYVVGQTSNNDIWTPAAGKKFRLMGGLITISKEAACAGAFVIYLADEAVNFMAFEISSGALVAMGVPVVIPFTLPGNGKLSSTANNDLKAVVSGGLTAGEFAINAWGTEE